MRATQVVILVLLPFLRQESDVLFQQDNARPHTAAATQRALPGEQQDLYPIKHVWDMMKRELTLSPEPTTTSTEMQVHRCEASDSMRACHAAGPGSIPGRDKFPG